MPVATFGVSLVDFLINLCLLIAMMVWYQFPPGWPIALLPIFLCLRLLQSLRPSFLITALNVKYRDFRFVIPYHCAIRLVCLAGRV